ncbi:adhesin, partial [Escherichia coli]|nr:adhesin [Escherichia coli]
INGSQLYAISKSVADRLGGGATVNAQGVVTAPNYRLKNGIYGNVGDALADLNNNTIQWDSVKKGYSAAHGTDATSTITNVKAGTISATSTDAVNGSQLNATNMMIEQNSQIINQLAGNTDATYIQENGAGINYVRTNDSGLVFEDASATGVGATAVGYNSVASGDS